MTAEDLIHQRTIHRVLQDKVQQYGNREFFRYLGKSFSYEDLEREANRVAKGLQSQGIKKGDKVAIVMKNRPEFLFIWLGLCKLGAIEVPINTAHRGSILTYMIDHADCRFFYRRSCEALGTEPSRLAPLRDGSGVGGRPGAPVLLTLVHGGRG